MRRGLPFCRASAAASLLAVLAILSAAEPLTAQVDPRDNEPGILEPVSSALQGREIRIPNTDQSVDGVAQANILGGYFTENAMAGGVTSMLGHEITHVASPHDDLRQALIEMIQSTAVENRDGMRGAAEEIKDILLGTTVGRIYDGFPLLNWNRYKPTDFGLVDPAFMPPDLVPGEYKMKIARDTGRRLPSPFDGEERKVWAIDMNLLYYDGQIDGDTFTVRFPVDHHPDDLFYVNYRVFSLVSEDFAPNVLLFDRREEPRTVQLPFKGFDAVWVGFNPGEVLNISVAYPPIRMLYGFYRWGWRVHPPRIQFTKPVFEIRNAWTGEVELDPEGQSIVSRNREEQILELIGDAAPEMKMYKVAKAVLLEDIDPAELLTWLIEEKEGPRGTWIEWVNLAREQRQLPEEAVDFLAEEEGLGRDEFGDYQMVLVYMNNELYGGGPFLNEIRSWFQGEVFRIKLINFDKHTHYFRNVDFGQRQHDDILRCCGGGETSFEIMNFKPTYGVPKDAELQWRAGWGFRPHYDIIAQPGIFESGSERLRLRPLQGGTNDDTVILGYEFSATNRSGELVGLVESTTPENADFLFNPPPEFIADGAVPFSLRDADGSPGLKLGQRTQGYGVAQMCPTAPPGDCPEDVSRFNPHGVLNHPSDNPTELRFPSFLRNPCQGDQDPNGFPVCGDLLPATDAWKPFLYLNPANGTLFLDPELGREGGYWTDYTYVHGAPVFPGTSADAVIELPRAAGQVFYQFDDVFHDNAIFSPHPVDEGLEIADEFKSFTATVSDNRRGEPTLRIRGRIKPLINIERTPLFDVNQFVDWLTVHLGDEGRGRCDGPFLGAVEVGQGGRFVLRCGGDRCRSLSDRLQEKSVADLVGQTICIRSPVAAVATTVVVQK